MLLCMPLTNKVSSSSSNTPPLINIKCYLACLNIVVTVVALISTPLVLPGMCETPPTRGQERMYSKEQRDACGTWIRRLQSLLKLIYSTSRTSRRGRHCVRRTGAKYKQIGVNYRYVPAGTITTARTPRVEHREWRNRCFDG